MSVKFRAELVIIMMECALIELSHKNSQVKISIGLILPIHENLVRRVLVSRKIYFTTQSQMLLQKNVVPFVITIIMFNMITI